MRAFLFCLTLACFDSPLAADYGASGVTVHATGRDRSWPGAVIASDGGRVLVASPAAGFWEGDRPDGRSITIRVAGEHGASPATVLYIGYPGRDGDDLALLTADVGVQLPALPPDQALPNVPISHLRGVIETQCRRTWPTPMRDLLGRLCPRSAGGPPAVRIQPGVQQPAPQPQRRSVDPQRAAPAPPPPAVDHDAIAERLKADPEFLARLRPDPDQLLDRFASDPRFRGNDGADGEDGEDGQDATIDEAALLERFKSTLGIDEPLYRIRRDGAERDAPDPSAAVDSAAADGSPDDPGLLAGIDWYPIATWSIKALAAGSGVSIPIWAAFAWRFGWRLGRRRRADRGAGGSPPSQSFPAPEQVQR